MTDQPGLLVVGAGGFLRAHVGRAAATAKNFKVTYADRAAQPERGIHEIDIASAAGLDGLFRRVQPRAVLLLAAISDIDKCEAAPEVAFAVNAKGAENVANACARNGARLLFTSTAAVFDGTRHGYREEDPPTPLSVYGRTKAWAEQAVSALVPSAIILRLALVLGFAGKGGTNAMLDRLMARWQKGAPVAFPTGEVRNPVDARRLVAVMLQLLTGKDAVRGIYHAGASDCVSRYDLGLQLAARAGVPANLVRVQGEPPPGRAPRGAKYGLACTSGTTGLQLTMIAAGVGPGDEVITTPISWIATANAAAVLGAKVVFADVDPRTLNLNPAKVAEKITPRTKAIVPVHLFGQCADIDALNELAKPRNILVVEDAAHAAGARYKGRHAGLLADMAVFSFHQQKNMVTLGEGGMTTTNDHAFYERMLSYRSLCCRSYDPKGKYLAIDDRTRPMGKQYWYLDFDDIGFNYRMTDAQAAVGLEQLKKLDGFNRRRVEIAHLYNEGLKDVRGLRVPYVAPENNSVYHAYCILLEEDFAKSKDDFM